jgi:isopenicillin N synthase-like dioxygenase
VEVLKKAVREKGFFYVKNFNIEQELVNRQFALGREFYELPLEEKRKYVPAGLGTSQLSSSTLDLDLRIVDQGAFNGYVPAGRRVCVVSWSSILETHRAI